MRGFQAGECPQSPEQCLEQQTEEVGEGVSEIVLVLKGGHQRS